MDHYTRKPRGFGFIEFKTVEDARAACEKLNGATVGDNVIEVVVAQQRRKSPRTMRKIQAPSRRDNGWRRDDYRDRRDRRSRSPYDDSRRRYRSRSYDRGVDRRRQRSYSR